MKISVLAIGGLKEAYFKAAEAEYKKRLGRYADVTVRELKDEAGMVRALPKRARLVLLDERGENLSSTELAKHVIAAQERQADGTTLVFAVGGATGFSNTMRERAHKMLAFGRVTLPHRIARIVLLEQIYRAYTILRGEPYHK